MWKVGPPEAASWASVHAAPILAASAVSSPAIDSAIPAVGNPPSLTEDPDCSLLTELIAAAIWSGHQHRAAGTEARKLALPVNVLWALRGP